MRLDQTLVQVRERSFLDVMDLALIVVRNRFWPIAATSALGIAPWAVLNAWLTSPADQVEPSFTVLLSLMALEAPIATAPITILLGGMMFGDRPRAGRILRTMLRSIVPLVLFQVLLRGILLVVVVLAWLVPLRLPFLNEVILLERGPLGRVVGRASELTGDRTGELLGQWVAMLGFGGGFALSFWYVTEKIGAMFRNDSVWEQPDWAGVVGGRGVLGIWIAVAFFAVVRFLTYLDQRIRLEGWEVELRLRAAGAALEGEREA